MIRSMCLSTSLDCAWKTFATRPQSPKYHCAGAHVINPQHPLVDNQVDSTWISLSLVVPTVCCTVSKLMLVLIAGRPKCGHFKDKTITSHS